MYGLTMRWSLLGAPEGVEEHLRSYVRDESLPRFTGRAGLHEKIWSMAVGGFFAGTYLWADGESRADFVDTFRASPSRVTEIIGHEPDVIEQFEVVAVAEGAAGLSALPKLGTAYDG
jgi:hypothetical protein